MPRKNMPENWEPPYPSYSADFDPAVEQVVVVYIGAQSREYAAEPFHASLRLFTSAENGPEHVERATFVDNSAYRNDVYICYWKGEKRYRAWSASGPFSEWWNDELRLQEDCGYWMEAIFAPKRRFETLFSSENRAGMAALAAKYSGEIKEHAYWGGMRDRIEDSENDELNSLYGPELVAADRLESRGNRLKISPPHNICLIRSAQNWTDCEGEELVIYQDEIQPVLLKGMNYIRDNPIETGCVSCRFMDELSLEGEGQSKTFGMAYFLTMAHLEAWAKSHPSHLAIFQGFHKMVAQLNGELDIKLWHEVIVLPAGDHEFEYVNCHPETGLLAYFPPD